MSKEFNSMTVAQLKEVLKEKGLSTEGKKNDLVQRLKTHEEEAALLEDIGVDTNGSGVDAVIGLSEDDLLNEGQDKDESPKKIEESTKAASPAKIVSTESSESTTDSAEKKGLSTDEKLKARAARFGLPISGTPAAEAVTPKGDDKLAVRAQRFGLTPPSVVNDEQKQKLTARAARFGVPVNADGKRIASSGPDIEKLAARAQRFGLSSGDSEMDSKKKARLARFGAI